MHRHPANCAIFLTDVTGMFELPGGETVEAGGTQGQVTCDEAEVHKPAAWWTGFTGEGPEVPGSQPVRVSTELEGALAFRHFFAKFVADGLAELRQSETELLDAIIAG